MITSCPFSVFLPWVGRGTFTTFCLAFSDNISHRMQTHVPSLIIIIIITITKVTYTWNQTRQKLIFTQSSNIRHHSIICCFPLFRGLVWVNMSLKIRDTCLVFTGSLPIRQTYYLKTNTQTNKQTHKQTDIQTLTLSIGPPYNVL